MIFLYGLLDITEIQYTVHTCLNIVNTIETLIHTYDNIYHIYYTVRNCTFQ